MDFSTMEMMIFGLCTYLEENAYEYYAEMCGCHKMLLLFKNGSNPDTF